MFIKSVLMYYGKDIDWTWLRSVLYNILRTHEEGSIKTERKLRKKQFYTSGQMKAGHTTLMDEDDEFIWDFSREPFWEKTNRKIRT